MIALIYLLKLVGCTGLFYGYYYLFLRNRCMHQYNRFYILASISLSVVLPLIEIPLATTAKDAMISTSVLDIAFGGWEREITLTANRGFLQAVITKQGILTLVYVSGLLLAVYPAMRSFIYIRSLTQKHPAKEFENIRFVDTAEPGTPFSFFNTVFWNKAISMETEEGQQILRHELFHIRQKHSYDILFMQLACSLLWFNPFCYLLNKELKVIHEFLADEYAASGSDKHQYAELLVLHAISPRQVFISNQFFYNQIKRRITMILQNKNTRYVYIRKAMTVPVIVLLFCACSVKNKDEENLTAVVNPATTVAPAKHDKDPRSNEEKIFEKVEIEASYVGGAPAWLKYLNKDFRYPQEALDKDSQGTVLVRFIVEKDGTLRNIETIEGKELGKYAPRGKAKYTTDESLKKEAVRMITESGKWLPAVQNGIKVTSYKIQPITFSLEEG